MFLVAVITAVQAQTARKLTVTLSDDGKASMVVYLPEKPTGRAVVDCPGGGYSHLATQHEGHDWAAWFNKRGVVFGVLTYRMPNGDRNIPLGDAQQAVRTMRDSAQVWGINPIDVGIMGFSAGGHLASAVSTHSEYDCRPNFSILFYPVISMNQRESHKGSCNNFLGEEGAKNEALVKAWSSQNAVRSHLTPPAIILTASDDRTVPPLTNGVAYYQQMRRAGNDCALYIYPSGGHGFGFRSSWTYHSQMLTDLDTWLGTLTQPRRGACRVACIGNSITHGSGIDMQERNAYPAQLQRLLGRNYVVKNYGVGARCMMNTSDHPYMNEQAWRDAKAFLPDVVLIKLGTNDSKDFQWNSQQYEQNYQAMIDTLTALKSHPRIILCTPVKPFRDKWGITDSVVVNGVIPIIRKIAERNRLEVIDLYKVITNAADMTADMIHPNDKGAAKMAQAIADILKPQKRMYIPDDLKPMNLQSDTSQWSMKRCRQTDDVIVMWERGFGDDPAKAPDLDGHPMTFDVRRLTQRVQDLYDYYRDTLQFTTPENPKYQSTYPESKLSTLSSSSARLLPTGRKNSQTYKMMVMVNYSLEGTAYGGAYDDTIGALWVAPNRIQDSRLNCIAHELGHSFQAQIMADGEGECWGGNGFFEMTSQWMLWQVNPQWLSDEYYHFEAFRKLTHKAFLSPENIYHSPYVIQWWSDLHGKTYIAQLFRDGKKGEDPVMTYKRTNRLSQKQFCDEMLRCYQHLMNFDFSHAVRETRPYACTFSSDVETTADGWQQPVNAPEEYGFNAISLDSMLNSGKTLSGVSLKIKGSHLRFGFVAVDAQGSSYYSGVNTTKYLLPARKEIAHLYLIVMGAPDKHVQIGGDSSPDVFPYKYKVETDYN